MTVDEVYRNDLASGVLMQASVRFRHMLVDGRVVLVPQALARHLGALPAGLTLSDAKIEINTEYFSEADNSRYKSVVMLHELLHGMGFFSMIAHYSQVTNRTLYSLYDHHLRETETDALLVSRLDELVGAEGFVVPLNEFSNKLYSIFGHQVYTTGYFSMGFDSLKSLSHLQNPYSSIAPHPLDSELRVSADAIEVLGRMGWCNLSSYPTVGPENHMYRFDRCYDDHGVLQSCPEEDVLAAVGVVLILFLLVLVSLAVATRGC